MKKLKSLVPICILLMLNSKIAFSQAIADFSADDTLGCNPMTVLFTNEGSSGPEYTYEWYFDGDGPYTDENPSYTFNNGSVNPFPVRQVVTNTSTSDTDEITKYITVIQTPSASLTIDQTNACVGGNVEFRTGGASKDSAFWDFGDGHYSKEADSRYVYHAYSANGSYNVQFITYRQICSDTSNYLITVDGPIAEFSVSDHEACKGTPITFTLGATTGVDTFFWSMGENNIVLTDDPATHSYDTMGIVYPQLHVNGASGACVIEDTIDIKIVLADFTHSDDKLCDQQLVFFQNTSQGEDVVFWDFDNGHTSISDNPTQTFDMGVYNIKLSISSAFGCKDSITKVITINEPPTLQMPNYAEVCPGSSIQIIVSGGDIIAWDPPEDFDDPTSYTPTVTPVDTSVYIATITDTTTKCSTSDSILVAFQAGMIPGKISVFPLDSSIVIGDTVAIFAYDTLQRDIISYDWTPVDGILTCNDCPNPIVRPLQTTTYTLVVSDTNKCYITETFDVYIEVREEYRIGVPDAFTPNGDGINDVIYVRGWGIQRLIEFRIYNRRGNEVFYTDDISQGWDGYYKGKLQSIDSYAYVIKAEMWNGQIIVKNGAFSLLR